MISLFVASKNRASQLRLLLESLNRNCSDLFDLNILYNFDDDSYKLPGTDVIINMGQQDEEEPI